jgi:hypothetical protein
MPANETIVNVKKEQRKLLERISGLEMQKQGAINALTEVRHEFVQFKTDAIKEIEYLKVLVNGSYGTLELGLLSISAVQKYIEKRFDKLIIELKTN